MRDSLDHKYVAVAVIYDKESEKFLLWHNKRWHGYAFPMKKFDPYAGDDPGPAAVEALRDWDMELDLVQASAVPLDRVVEVLFSDGTHRLTVYDYHVYAVDVSRAPTATTLHPDFRHFTFDELLTAINVTSSTQAIAQSLVENRRVALAVVTRHAPRGREFLLVKNRLGEYFFPASRMKDRAIPNIAAAYAVSADLGYDAGIDVAKQAEVPAVQESTRFGARLVQFHYFLCLVNFPDPDPYKLGNQQLDLNKPDSLLETSREKLAKASGTSDYSQWFTEDELRTRADMSPSVAAVLETVLQLAT